MPKLVQKSHPAKNEPTEMKKAAADETKAAPAATETKATPAAAADETKVKEALAAIETKVKATADAPRQIIPPAAIMPRGGFFPPMGPVNHRMGPIMGPMHQQFPRPFFPPIFTQQILMRPHPHLLPPAPAPEPEQKSKKTKPKQTPKAAKSKSNEQAVPAKKSGDSKPAQKSSKESPKPAPTKTSTPVSKEVIKEILYLYFSTHDISLQKFCQRQPPPLNQRPVYYQLTRIISKHPKLKELEKQRGEASKRNEAISIIEQILPGPSFQQSTASVVTTEKLNDEFFSKTNIGNIASKLDFEKQPRTTRTGDGVIQIHGEKKITQHTWNMILLLYKQVTWRHPAISKNDKSKLRNDVARIVLYDHGYKEGKVCKSVVKAREQKLVDYFKSGLGMEPVGDSTKPPKEKDSRSEEEKALQEIWKKMGVQRGVEPEEDVDLEDENEAEDEIEM